MRLTVLACAAAAMAAGCDLKTPEAVAAASTATSGAPAAIPAYEPMAVFAPFVGKTFRGEWTDPDGTKVVDIAKYNLILNGRALQSTHRLEGKEYGGRTIFFYDEGAEKYLFHYFTTGGFHTTGEATLADGGLVIEEKAEGHETIATVRSNVTFGADEVVVDVDYVGKDGSETSGGSRVYKPIADPGRLFPDTE